MMWQTGEWWGFGMGFALHGVFMLAFWGLLVWGTVFLARQMMTRASQSQLEQGDRALAMVRERYARGELTREQLEALRRDLL